MQTDNGLWWDENDPPDWIVDTPFADVAIGFGLEKATITVAGKTFRLQLEGVTEETPTGGYLRTRSRPLARCWGLSGNRSRTVFRRENQLIKIVWQSGEIGILHVFDAASGVALHYEVVRIFETDDALELLPEKSFLDFDAAYSAAF